MKYRTIGPRLGHKIFVRERETEFDKKKFYSRNKHKSFEDTTQMKSHEFAAFQKKMFQQMKKDRKRRKIIFILSFIITLLLILGFLIFWNNYDFDLLNASEY